jgi:hypothetical protein
MENCRKLGITCQGERHLGLRDSFPFSEVIPNGIPGIETATMLRGRFVVRDGKLVGGKGDGRYVSGGKP